MRAPQVDESAEQSRFPAAAVTTGQRQLEVELWEQVVRVDGCPRAAVRQRPERRRQRGLEPGVERGHVDAVAAGQGAGEVGDGVRAGRVEPFEDPVDQGAEAGAARQVVPQRGDLVQMGVHVAVAGPREGDYLGGVRLVVLLRRLGLAAERPAGGGAGEVSAGAVGRVVRGRGERAVRRAPPAEVEAAVEPGQLQPRGTGPGGGPDPDRCCDPDRHGLDGERPTARRCPGAEPSQGIDVGGDGDGEGRDGGDVVVQQEPVKGG